MQLCSYCGEERGDKFGCCGEVHFDEVGEDELSYMEAKNIGVYELQEKRQDFETWLEQQPEKLNGTT